MSKLKKAAKYRTDDAVRQFHDLAGQPINTEPTVPDIRAIRFRNHFMLEEFIEGIEAQTHKNSLTGQRVIEILKQAQAKINELQPEDIDVDFEELADSLTDQLYVVEGTGLYYGILTAPCFDECHEKNLTRFPKTQEELDATLEKAKGEGIEVEATWREEHNCWAVIRKDNGKLYKNAMHVKPDFKKILGIKG